MGPIQRGAAQKKRFQNTVMRVLVTLAKNKREHIAGTDRGSHFMPEIDDEVLVRFVNGDME